MSEKNFKLTIEYDGTGFFGWQTQAKGRTVQGELEEALSSIVSGEKITLTGSGRTDSGVHALNQVAHVKLDTRLHPEQLMKALNAMTGDDLLVKDCRRVSSEFHARFSAKKRTYQYRITTRYSPFTRFTRWWLKYPVKFEQLNLCARMIIGEHDFSSFCKANADVPHKRCHIFESHWVKEGDNYAYTIAANRFLQHMVRYLVGTMVEVARGRMSPDDFEIFLRGKHEKLAVFRAPAKGLFLTDVYYGE